MSSNFSKCPNCEAPFPIFVHVEADGVKGFTEVTLRCTCYQCGAIIDVVLKLGNLDEVRRNVS